MRLRLSHVVFLRLSAGDPDWLARLRWPTELFAEFDHHNRLAAEEAGQRHRAIVRPSEFSAQEWQSVLTWLDRASSGQPRQVPRLLRRSPDRRSLLLDLLAKQKERSEHFARLSQLLDRAQADLENAALRLLADGRLLLIALNASTALTPALHKATAGHHLPVKDRRRLARTIYSLAARSTHKSCPLAFSADTAVIRMTDRDQTKITVGGIVYVAMQPNQDASNRIINLLYPIGAYLQADHSLHLNLSARVENGRLLWWREARSGPTVRESLIAVTLPPEALDILQSMTGSAPASALHEQIQGSEASILMKLADSRILVREDEVTPLDHDPWVKIDAAYEHATDTDKARAASDLSRIQPAREFSRPQEIQPANMDAVARALEAACRDDGPSAAGRVSSGIVSVNTYRSASGGLTPRHQETVRQAIAQYLALAGLAYPLTPTFRKRQRYVDHFRRRYGDDTPVPLERVLIEDWESIDQALAFLLSPEHSPVHPDSDLLWPQPAEDSSAYAKLYGELQRAGASGQAQYEIPTLDVEPPAPGSWTPVIDVICRLGKGGDGDLDVLVESATAPGRLVERHLNALSQLDPSASDAVASYLGDRSARQRAPRGEGVPTVVVATHAQPRLQNLCATRWAGEHILPISEPAPGHVPDRVIRYHDLYVRFDSRRARLAVHHGSNGPILDVFWRSPVSPSFSRRLHFLRFVTLATRPVITAPRWMPWEAASGGHMPRAKIGPLLLSPQRWSFPTAELASRLAAAAGRAAGHIELRMFQSEHGLPDDLFVYSSHNTRPAFVDLASPWGTEIMLRSLRRAAAANASTLLFEERFPAPANEIIDTPSGSSSLIVQCELPSEATAEGMAC